MLVFGCHFLMEQPPWAERGTGFTQAVAREAVPGDSHELDGGGGEAARAGGPGESAHRPRGADRRARECVFH